MDGSEKRKRIRTCVGCSAQSDKVELLRIVRKPDKTVSFDRTGRVPGRGAYVCSAECLMSAFRSKKLQRALKTPVGQEEVDAIALQIGEAASEEGRR